jgi:hypothetical protein
MSERFSYILERTEPVLGDLIESWSTVGLILENPGTGLVSCLLPGGEEQLDRTAFGQRFRSGAVTFQLWIGERSDVICSCQQLEIGVEHVYWLDGLSPEQLETMTTWTLNRFRALTPELIPIITVIELDSNTGPDEWRAFVRQEVLPIGVPQVVGVKAAWAPLFARALPEIETIDGYKILRRPPQR